MPGGSKRKNLDRFQYLFQPINFVNSVDPSPHETQPYNKVNYKQEVQEEQLITSNSSIILIKGGGMQTFAPELIFSAGPQINQTEVPHYFIIFPLISFPLFPKSTFPANTQVPYGNLSFFFLNCTNHSSYETLNLGPRVSEN